MVAWNFASVRTLGRVEAVLKEQTLRQANAMGSFEEYTSVKSEVLSLREHAKQIGRLDSYITMTGVLGELSYLLDGSIVLSEVSFTAEKLTQKDGMGPGGSVVRAASAGKEKPLAGGAVRFKIVIKGVASTGMEAAGFVSKLEKSAYFRDVTSQYLNKEIGDGSDDRGNLFKVSEFEIVCYLSNYKKLAAVYIDDIERKVLQS
jgi:hypothetical protein